MSDTTQPIHVIVRKTEEQANQAALELFKIIVCESVADRGACRIALAGGTTPHPLYQHLAAESVSGDVPWSGVEIFFGDERDVPHDHADSNYRMAQRALLDHVPIPPQQVHPMPADAEDLTSAAARYEQTIRRFVPAENGGKIPRFDLILLGMGADGHTASLFPGTDALKEKKKLVVANFVPVLSRHRMTFTYPLINASRNVLMVVTREDKADVVARLLDKGCGAPGDLPAAGVRPEHGLFTLILDAAAARNTGLPTEE